MRKRSIFYFIVFLSLSTLVSLNSCLYHYGVEGNGVIVEEVISTPNFDAVSIGGAFEVYYTQADNVSIKLITDSNLHDIIDIHVKNDELIVRTDSPIRDFSEMKLIISSPDLRNIDISGACKFVNNNVLETKRLNMDLSGASEIDMELVVDYLDIESSGASHLKFYGVSKDLQLELSGASEFEGFSLETENAFLNLSGASDCELFVNEILDIEASGASKIRYKGNPAKLITNLSGASSVERVN
jgi:hypothetical protein